MKSQYSTVAEYIDNLPEERKAMMNEIRKVILKNLPKGFEECMNYGMIGYVVPHSLYPKGYCADPKQPLPFMNLASQKNSVSFYHMGLYAGTHTEWFMTEYTKFLNKKPDMGKSCIRFKKMSDVPLQLIGALVSKISVQQWIQKYEETFKKK